MTSDLYSFDGSSSSSSSIFLNSSPEMFPSDTTTRDLFCNNELYSVNESVSMFDHFTPQLLSSSPPSDLHGTLTLSQQIPTGLYSNFSDFQISDAVKTETFFDGGSGDSYTETMAAMARSYSAVENVKRYMQRSFSSNSVDGKQNQLPLNNPKMDSSSLHYNTLNWPENVFFSGQMRRVYSTGDLQNVRRNVAEQRSSAPFPNEQNFKVGRYSVEERKEKISKYRAKRNQRNFTKTIKYACRKTLADSRPRIRGRFARNDEIIEIPKTEDDDVELWKLDGLHEKEEAFVVDHSHLQYGTSSSYFW